METTRLNKAASYALLFLSGLLLSMHGYLASFTRLMADDFCSLYTAERFGLLRSIWYWRLLWSGRYSAFGADWLFARLLGPYSFPILMPLLLVIWLLLTCFAVYLFLQDKAPQKNNKMTAILAGSLILFLVFTISPDIQQSFYWLNGMRSYTLPLIAITVNYIFYKLWAGTVNTKPKLILGGLAAFLLFFASAGFSETFAVLQFFLLLYLIVVKLLSPSGGTADATLLVLVSGLAGTVASLVVIISAPGNAIRQAQLPPHPDLVGLFTISIQGYGNYLSGIFLSAVQFAGLIGVLAAFIWLGGFYQNQYKDVKWQIPIVLAGGVLLSFICIPPGVFGYSEPPPARTVIIPFFVLTIFLSYSCFLGGSWLMLNKAPLPYMILRGVLILSVLLIGYSSLTQTYLMYKQKDVYVNFAENWKNMDEQIWRAKARGDASVTVPENENWAKLNVLIDNPKFWVNVCFLQYYGIPVFGPNFDMIQP